MTTLLEDLFELRRTKGETPDWGINKFPDGQIQFWIEEGDTTAKGQFDLVCALPTPEAVDLFRQIWNTLDLASVRITYLYGARSDKDRAGDRLVANVAWMFFNILSEGHLNSVHNPYRRTVVEFVAPHCDKLVKSYFDDNPNVKMVWPVHSLLETQGYDLVVFPDESAERRFKEVAPQGVRQLTLAKHRDQVSGQIESQEDPTSEIGDAMKILVMDDLCDGGRTFIELGKKLKEASKRPDRIGWAKLHLSVTHGLFSGEALSNLYGVYNSVWTTDSLPWAAKKSEKLGVFVSITPVFKFASQ